jgi:hypothetical protein
MNAITAPFGSELWLNQVFQTSPARKVKGRTKWTHRHAPWVEALNRLAYVESRNELIALLALEHLQRQGVIRRFKEQPFTTPLDLWSSGIALDIPQHMREYTPDLIAESSYGDKYVIEVKSARYITRQMERDFELWKEKFVEYDLKYLVWTDRDPLAKSLRQNLLELRRTAVQHIEPDEVHQLIDLLTNKGPLPVWALYTYDLDRDLISHAAWKGKVFFPLHEPFAKQTVVSLNRTTDLESLLFGAEPDMEAWWNSLEAA